MLHKHMATRQLNCYSSDIENQRNKSDFDDEEFDKLMWEIVLYILDEISLWPLRIQIF